jgi:predicted HTH transcriptional regulator
MKLRQRHKGGYLSFGDHERKILAFLSENDSITIDKMKEVASIPRPLAEKILINLMLMDVVAFSWDGHQFVFRINTVSMGLPFQ